MEARWQHLARHAYSGVARDDIAPGIRYLVSGEYLTLYRLTGGAVEIIRVLHGRRKISPKSLFKGWPRSGELTGALQLEHCAARTNSHLRHE
ncbi:type II toxin-antitoxin system RelE/ParE family toxin [Rhizobium sp. BK068]|uniref:type II toxin-antitoxin system RelE/ParE family toxin n=1 Tax=Rhizobium sp. BK060 TaxID=2587096 RepID=UPI001FE0B332|nr:type II toxin-antitoxin system RelE/ParE family toxin [Rhizobium sp. BK068]